MPRISSSLSEPWVAWLMLGLLILLVLSDVLQRGLLLNRFKELWHVSERENMFGATTINVLGQVCLDTYKISIFGLTAYALLFTTGTFRFLDALWIGLLVLGMVLLKYAVAQLIGYVFFDQHLCAQVIHHYAGLTTCCSVLLYPILLVILFCPFASKWWIVGLCGALCLFFLCILLRKVFLLFFHNFVASFYILLYLCTLEVIPFVGLFYIGGHIVN